MNAVWKVIDSTNPQVVAFRDSHYGSIWSNYQRTVPDWRKTTSINLLTMLPTVITALLPTPTPTPISGDINHDGKVDIFDYNLLVADFGKTTPSPADINRDGKVDIFDYNILVGNFGKI